MTAANIADDEHAGRFSGIFDRLKDKEANWLPAPTGPFVMFMCLYWPKNRSTERHVDRVTTQSGGMK
jgi:hypothetical protein